MIRFKVNGKGYSRENSLSLTALIEELNIPSGSVAIEQNRSFIQRDDWSKTMVADGDVIELIRPFSGG